jgi:hypothetical protein
MENDKNEDAGHKTQWPTTAYLSGLMYQTHQALGEREL